MAEVGALFDRDGTIPRRTGAPPRRRDSPPTGRRRPLHLLIAGQAWGQAGDGLAQIAFAQVVLFEVGRGATPAEIAALLAATLLPFSLVGPFAGLVIDRWDRRRVMVALSLGRVALVLGAVATLAWRWRPGAYVGVVLLLSTSRFVLAARGAALPRTVPARELVEANARSALAGMVAAFAGAVIGSTFVAAVPAAGFFAASGCYLAAATFFRRLPPVGGGEQRVRLAAGVGQVAAELAEGARWVAGRPAVRRPLVSVWAHRLLLGAGFIVLVLHADSRYQMEAPGYGLALLVTGAGAFVGTLAVGRLAVAFHSEALRTGAFWLAGAAALVGGFASTLAVLIVALGVVGFAFQVLKVRVDAEVGAATDDQVRGRVFSAYDVLYNLAFVLAGLALVPLWEPGRESQLLWTLAAAFFAVGGVYAHRVVGPATTALRPVPRRRWPGRLAGALVGTLPAAAFPEADLGWVAWVGLVPLLLVVRAPPTRREGAVRAWLGGAGFLVATHHWLAPVLGVFTVPLSLALALLWLPWGAAAWSLLGGGGEGGGGEGGGGRGGGGRGLLRLAAAVTLLPAGWVAIEFLRSWEHLGGPFGLLGSTQWDDPPMLAAAAVGGVWAVSFLVVMVNVALAAALSGSRATGRRAAALVVAAAALLASPAYHLSRGQAEARGTVRVGVVQVGVTRGPAARFDAGERLTRALIGQEVDLVIWGESSVGFDLGRRPDLLDRLQALSRRVGADLLVNVDARRSDAPGIYKSSILVTPEGVAGRYDKMRLVPFGEYIPLRPALGFVHRFTEAAEENRRRGEGLEVLDSGGTRLGPLVCFESAFPDLSRHLARRGAELIVFQSATTTFQDSWAPEMHAGLAAVRAVETSRPVVHATLTGVTAAADGRGRPRAWMGTDRRGVRVLELPLSAATTPYVRLGDWVPAASFALLALGVITGVLGRGRLATEGESASEAVAPAEAARPVST